tara:strand:- start:76 stop:582 length:507 start_codon:yes stop_codon:yes gene_type:complete
MTWVCDFVIIFGLMCTLNLMLRAVITRVANGRTLSPPVQIDLLDGKFNYYEVWLSRGKAVDIVLEPEQVRYRHTPVPGTLILTKTKVTTKWRFKCTPGLEVLYKPGKGSKDNTIFTVKTTAKTFEVLHFFYDEEDDMNDKPNITIYFPNFDNDLYPPSVTGIVKNFTY